MMQEQTAQFCYPPSKPVCKDKLFFLWPNDTIQICNAIRAKKEILRIIIKTKNDELLIERWIKHYLNILGDDSQIIILDNMSTSKIVNDVYEKYNKNLIVIKFSESYNFVHIVDKFKLLYDAIWDSSCYYTFVDTDEFLYLYDGKKLICDDRIILYLENNKDINFFSQYWLRNVYFRDDIFTFNNNIKDIHGYIMFGKPIINSSLLRNKIHRLSMNIHTVHLPVSAYGKSPACFVLLHRSHLSKEARIRVNMEKLVTVGVVNSVNDFKSLFNININSVKSKVVKYFINETRELIEDNICKIDNDDEI
ncbi:MAG: glycosyltransferase family 2 protein, partial [Desulfovibrio sp.]|nr:glycosyltransferase family 2 protein [Desulfovibrio sp.]